MGFVSCRIRCFRRWTTWVTSCKTIWGALVNFLIDCICHLKRFMQCTLQQTIPRSQTQQRPMLTDHRKRSVIHLLIGKRGRTT
ncbi:hypothetical protein GK3250 [Geobacillus kaustophilus HTA426]|uniref:Uncharacterized protein n=1 Tax=Geobacillus kaustophilus (strain HTA426) TaxID=235909 RepID=Q5KUV1_GEOKA|nr:hypothetical protein GK3250 [Geobacillus kaustophilus HTA426]